MRALVVVVAGVVVGAAVAAVVARPLLAALAGSSLARVNYRGRVVVAGLGFPLLLATVAWTALLAVALRLAPGALAQVAIHGVGPGLAAVTAAAAFTALGLLDDLAGDGDVRGFRGHVGALARGRVTGGGVKLVGGALAALFVAALVTAARPLWVWLVAAVVVASAANLANLLDLRPARVAKVLLPLWVVAAVLAPEAGAWAAGTAGAAVGVLPAELAEEGMLGDAGANALGAVTGVTVVAGPTWFVVVLAVVLVAAQAVSERVSFSRVIDGNRVLRGLDELGRRGREA